MLKAHSEIMTSRRLRSEKAANLEEVLSIKLSLKHSLSIFANSPLKKPGCRSKIVMPRFLVRPDLRIRTEFGVREHIWDSLPDFFFKAELVPVGMAHIL